MNITPESISENSCIQDGWDEEKNIVRIGQTLTLKPFIGTIEKKTCGWDFISEVGNTFNDLCINENEGWTLLKHEQKDGDYSNPELRTTWAREKISSTTPPPGDDWINISSNLYVRSVPTVYDPDNSGLDESGEVYITSYKIGGEDVAGTGIDNASRLEEILITLNPCPGKTIVSNFFGINPDGSAPDNKYYQDALNYFQNVVLFAKTDVKRPNADQNATVETATFESLYKSIKAFVPIRVFIEGEKLRIEHVSYRNESVGLNLLNDPYLKYIKGKKKFSFNSSEQPKYERFRQMDEVSPDFQGEIVYVCSSKDAEPVEHRSEIITTDIAQIIARPDTIADEGFAMANAIEFNGEYYFDRYNGKLNGRLGFKYLLPNMWTYGRYQSSGKIAGQTVAFESPRAAKIQTDLEILELPRTYPGTAKPYEKIISQLGEGKIRTATFSPKAGKLTISLRHV